MSKPGEVYWVDLGTGGKIRMMIVVSRHDLESPRALTICVPITSQCRGSKYEVEFPKTPFLKEKSYANVQAIQVVGNYELGEKVGSIFGEHLEKVKEAIKWSMEL